MVNIPIVLSSDNNYAPFVAVTIASICSNTQSFCDFYVLDGGITDENKDKICTLKNQYTNFSLEFIKVDIEKELKTIQYKNQCSHVTMSTYNRFLIPKFFKNFKKILYLDVDIIALGDITALYETDLENYALGAVSEEQTNPRNAQERRENLNLNSLHSYFNAGVLLIDVQKWIKEDIFSRLCECEQKYRDTIKWADQDILNIVFDNNYKTLDYKFNYMTDKNNIQSDIVIRHYNTNIKPWHFRKNLNTSLIRHIKEFWEVADKTNFLDILEQNCKYQTTESLHKEHFKAALAHRLQKR